jgi:hypothetical protein
MALIGWWPLDGNTEDYTVNQNHGVNNNVTWANGKIGQAGSFNGTNSYIDILNKAELNPGTKDFSISLWLFIPVKGSSYRGIFTKNYTQAFGVFDVTSGFDSVGLYIRSGANANMINFTDSYGKWTHCVWTVSNSGNIQKSYKNGVFQNQTTHTVGDVTSTNNINIGRYSINGTGYFSGQVNDARLYDHILSQKEINDLVKAKVLHYTFNKDESIIYDGSGYKRNGVKNNSPVWNTDSALGSGAYSFNQSSVSASSLNIPIKEFTITFFAKLTEYSYMTIGAPNNQSFEFKWRIAGQNPYWNVYWDGGNTTGMSYGFAPPLNEWHMYTLSHNGTIFKWYYDGQLINSRTITSGTFFNINTISTSGTGGEYLRGSLDNMILYTTMLSDENILDLYQTRAKIDNQGNLYANEFVEDYEVASGLTLRELFEDNNYGLLGPLVDNDSNNIADGTSKGSAVSVFSFSNGVQTFTTPAAFSSTGNNHWIIGTYNAIAGDIYFLGIIAKRGSTSGQLRIQAGSPSQYFVLTENFEWFSSVYTAGTSAFGQRFRLGSQTVGLNISFKDSVLCNLSEVFGSGNEPSQAQMDIWYRDYIQSRTKSNGQVITSEFNEVGIDTIAYEGKSYKTIFETNNMINFGNQYSSFTSTAGSILTRNDEFIRVDLGTSNDHRVIYTLNNTVNANNQVYYRMTHETDGTTDSFYIYFPGITSLYNFVGMSAFRNSTFSTIITHVNSGTSTYSFGRAVVTNIPTQGSYTKLTGEIIAINLSTAFTVVPTKTQMDVMYNEYRKLKIQEQSLKMFKDKILIKGSLYEGG